MILRENIKFPWQERLVDEYEFIRSKCETLYNSLQLTAFEDIVGSKQYDLLKRQYIAMCEYRNILEVRLIDLELYTKED